MTSNEPQPTGVPADYRAHSHRHFPGEVKSQPFQRAYTLVPSMSKKARWIISGVAPALFSLAMATLVGAKVGISMAKKPMPPPPL
jgi:hypothetical protein